MIKNQDNKCDLLVIESSAISIRNSKIEASEIVLTSNELEFKDSSINANMKAEYNSELKIENIVFNNFELITPEEEKQAETNAKNMFINNRGMIYSTNSIQINQNKTF